MENSERNKYIYLSIILIIAIITLIIFVIIPKDKPVTPEGMVEKIDFSTSEWIEEYMDKNVGIFGKDFYLNSAFTYNIRSNKMIVTYASQNSVEELRENYLALAGAELVGRNDETSLNVIVDNEDHILKVFNYYSPVSRVLELELTLNSDDADQIINQLSEMFPSEVFLKIKGINDLIAGDQFGGYVRYRYDQLDEFSHPYIPIFSQAYLFSGSEEDFNTIVNDLSGYYLDHQYDPTQDAHYFMTNGQILSISHFLTDADESVVSISLQVDKNQE